MDSTFQIKQLEFPNRKVDVVLDTDTFNEVDDQIALAYLIKSDEKLNLKALYAAPFFNEKSTGPEDGMEKSYNEILNILSLMERDDLKEIVYKGSRQYLEEEVKPVISPAAEHLCQLAMNYSTENPLYVIAIGAITNVASAILLKPEIIEKIVVVWLGGSAYHWQDACGMQEFNMVQDIAAARVVFGSGVPLVQLPCMGVVSTFTTTACELEKFLKGKNKLCDYLYNLIIGEMEYWGGGETASRILWDVTAVAWLLDESFMLSCLDHSPIPEYDSYYSFSKSRHFIRYVYHIYRDPIFKDLFSKLADSV